MRVGGQKKNIAAPCYDDKYEMIETKVLLDKIQPNEHYYTKYE